MKYLKLIFWIIVFCLYLWLARIKFFHVFFTLFGTLSSEVETYPIKTVEEYILPDLLTLLTAVALMIFSIIKIYRTIKESNLLHTTSAISKRADSNK